MKRYRYKLEKDFCIQVPGVDDCEYPCCNIKDGMLTIEKGYPWNGCSPWWPVLGVVNLGTPDGVVDYQTGKPMTYYASLVHDCMVQYEIATSYYAYEMFKKALLDVRFPLARLYACAVMLFGKEW